MKTSFYLTYAICICVTLTHSESLTKGPVKALAPLEPSESYTQKADIFDDLPNHFIVLWKILDSDEVQFEVHCNTTGWVGLGISANGGMKDSDIAIGWFDAGKGKAHLIVILL